MPKKLIDVDIDLLTEAKEILGASTWKDTVNSALDDVVNRHRRRQLLRFLKDDNDLGNPEVMAGAWRQ